MISKGQMLRIRLNLTLMISKIKFLDVAPLKVILFNQGNENFNGILWGLKGHLMLGIH